MNTEPEQSLPQADATPSADFIHAISEFFDTDPSDLLVELGYYQRQNDSASHRTFADMAAQQE